MIFCCFEQLFGSLMLPLYCSIVQIRSFTYNSNCYNMCDVLLPKIVWNRPNKLTLYNVETMCLTYIVFTIHCDICDKQYWTNDHQICLSNWLYFLYYRHSMYYPMAFDFLNMISKYVSLCSITIWFFFTSWYLCCIIYVLGK